MIFSWFFLICFLSRKLKKNSWNQNRAKRCDTNVLRSRAHWAEWRGLFWSRQKNSCNHGDLLLPRAIWRVFGDPGHHAPHTGSNAALHLYTPAAGLGPIRGFGTGGTLCRPRLKPKQEIEIPMFYNYLSQLQNLPSWARTRVCLPPLYEAEWLIESIQVTYIQSWEKLVECLHLNLVFSNKATEIWGNPNLSLYDVWLSIKWNILSKENEFVCSFFGRIVGLKKPIITLSDL